MNTSSPNLFTQATNLRMKLEYLGTERGDLIEARHALDKRTGEALAEVRATPRLSMAAAAELLGISRTDAYRILEKARRRTV